MFTKFKWLSMALKDATRNKRRSMVTLAITATGTAAALLGGGFALYTYQSLAEASARDTGHLVLAAPKFFDGVENMPLEHGLPQPEALTRQLLARHEVKRVLPRLQFSGLVSNGDKSEIFLGTGVDATQEFVVKGPFMKREAGELLDNQVPGTGPGVVIGKGLAKILSVQPGSVLTLMSTTINGSLNAMDVTVTGVVSTGIADIDKRLAIVDLATAQSLLLTKKVSTLSVYLNNIVQTDAVAAALRASSGGTLDVRTWLDQALFYKSVKGLYDRIFGFLGVIVLVIVLFSVTNTLAMAVLERTREIGTLRAMGATPGEVMRVFTLEGLALGSGGAILGMLLAGGVALFLLLAGLQMPAPPGRTDGYPLVVSVSASMYATAALAVALLSGAASWFVSRKAARHPLWRHSLMFKQIILAALLTAAGQAGAAEARPDVDAILRKADSFRLPDSSAELDTVVQTFKGGKPDKEKRYQVLIKPGGKSLVLSRSPGEAGQKVLMSGDDFWLLIPGSARPLRITPMQKLLGDASTGDIANMTWAGDYSGAVVRELEVDGVPCLELELAALRKSLSYQRIVLHVAKADYRPVHADLFAASDRKIKQAHYGVETRNGRTSVTQMTLVDEIQSSRETQVRMLSNKPRKFGDELFNPMYLSRNDVAP